MADGDGERMRERERGSGGRTAFHGDGITECKRARVRGGGFSRIPIESFSPPKTELAARSLARSVSSISIPRFSLACAPAFASRPSVRPHPQSATSQRYDVRVFLPSMIPCALAGEQDASGGGENSHVKTVGEKNLEEERKRRGPPAAAATAPPPFPIAPSLLPVQVPRALSSENMTTIISAVLERGGGGEGAAGRRAGGGKVGSCERT